VADGPFIDADMDMLRSMLGTVSNEANTMLRFALDACRSWVAERHYAAALERPEVRFATVLGASRLYKRRQSPEGVAGWGDLGVVRIVMSDPDITRLLEHHEDMTKAGVA
jgi:hypothetical protein